MSTSHAPSDSKVEGSRGTFHAAYQSLMAKAARGGLLPLGGLTPREQRDRLMECGALSAAHVSLLQRLTDLLELCVYAQAGTVEQAEEGIALCPTLASALPNPPTPRRQFVIHSAIGRLVPFLVAAGLAVLAVLFAMNLKLGTGGSINTDAWMASAHAESLAIHSSAGHWSTPKSAPTWRAFSISNVLNPVDGASQAPLQMDLDTGTDGWFPNATDPFQPPLNWTHRLHVFTDVDEQYQFSSVPSSMRDASGPSDSGPFYSATVRVMVQANTPAPIPSPSPDAVVVSSSSTPRMGLRFVKDHSDVLYVVAPSSQTIDLRYRLAVRTDYNSAVLPDAPFSPVESTLPANVRADAAQVIAAIGQLPGPTYRDTVRRLHAYFASFSVAPTHAHERQRNEFLTVALGRKGVCRHRARAFFVTANALGIPTRLVENQCHSFCEIQLPNGAWRRMEFRLGNEEGPPGNPWSPNDSGWSMASYSSDPQLLLVMAAIIAAALLVMLLSAIHLRDATGHLLHHRQTPRAVMRARRDGTHPSRSPIMAALIGIASARWASRFQIDPTNRQVLHVALSPNQVPRMIQARMSNILHASESNRRMTSVDGYDLQRTYWDCYHILRWLDREKHV